MPEIKRKQRDTIVQRVTEALVHWGRHPFAPRDEADGSVVNYSAGRVRLHRGPDGYLVAYIEPEDMP